MKWFRWALLVLGVLLLLVGGVVSYTIHNLQIEQLDDDLFVLYGAGGNVAVLRTDAGTVVVDTMTFQYQGGRIRSVAEELTGSDVVMVINSHYHTDHTHGNPAFASGTRVVATDRTLEHMLETDAEYFDDIEELLPNETFSGRRDIEIGGKRLGLLWPGRGHTDGDLIVFFEEESVLHTGDLYFNQHYPNIDLEGGGSVQEWSRSIDRMFEFDFDRVIPGHGPVSGVDGLRQFQGFISQLATLARDTDFPLERFVAEANLTEDASYTEITMLVPIGLDRDFVLTRAWQELYDDTLTIRP